MLKEYMAVILVTYDLKKQGQNYTEVHAYLKRFTHCKGLESVYLLDTTKSPTDIREAITKLVDTNDVIFVTKLVRTWSSWGYQCADWLNHPRRTW